MAARMGPALRIEERTPLSCPITTLSAISETSFALAGTARRLVLVNVNSGASLNAVNQDSLSTGIEWTVFERERIHRIVWRPVRGTSRQREALVLGGKEAALVDLHLPGDGETTSGFDLHVKCRFRLDDVVGDGAFLGSSHVLLTTLHCSIHSYRIPSSTSSSSSGISVPPLLSPSRTRHAPQRPLLWAARFSQPFYKDANDLDRSTPNTSELVRIAGGSMWGDTFLWDVTHSYELVRDHSGPNEAVRGSLRRLQGHKGAVFSATWNSSATRLATCSDDRTIRIWDLSNLAFAGELEGALETDVSAAASSGALPVITPERAPHLTLWAHEGRVWRTEFLPVARSGPTSPTMDGNDEASASSELLLLSVGEDATCRLWSATPTSAKGGGEGQVLKTWRDGHDGRSIWSLAIVPVREGALDTKATESRRYVLTGGADGAIRSWELPASIPGSDPSSSRSKERRDDRGSAKNGKVASAKGDKVIAFRVAPSDQLDSDDSHVAVTLSADGSFRAFATRAARQSSSSATTIRGELPPFAVSAAFAGAYGSSTLHLLPDSNAPSGSSSSASFGAVFRLFAFSNRGFLLQARLEHRMASQGGEATQVEVSEVRELEIGIKANEVAFAESQDENGDCTTTAARRVAVWERAGHRIVVLDLDAETHSVRQLAQIQLDKGRPSLMPTALRFLTPSLLLVGTARGHLCLFRLAPTAVGTSTNDSTLLEVARLEKVHGDTINRIVIRASIGSRSGETGTWTIETVARDGASCLSRVSVPQIGAATIEQTSQRQLTKGWIEEILPEGRYLALVDTRLAVLDQLGQGLESHRSASKKALAQLVTTPHGDTHYYCTDEESLLCRPLRANCSDAATTVLRTGLHGREIRAAAPLALTSCSTPLVATAAENGLLTISRLDEGALTPLYCDRYLPGSYKSLVWSAWSESTSTDPDAPRLLFACGTRASLSAFRTSMSSRDDGSMSLEVLPCGDELADEGEELRAMDLAAIPLAETFDRRHLVFVGYSDGIIRVWLHDTARKSFEPVCESKETGKCVLCVETAVVRSSPEGQERTLLITTASDGLVSIRDVSLLIRAVSDETPSAPTALPAPFHTARPHPSGINAVSIFADGVRLLLATAGDDNAVVVSQLSISSTGDSISATELGIARLPTAHSSTIQGLDLINNGTGLISSSVDQRLNTYSLSVTDERSGRSVSVSLSLVDSTCLDVADCSAQVVVTALTSPRRGASKRTGVLVVGIGAEMVWLNQDETRKEGTTV